MEIIKGKFLLKYLNNKLFDSLRDDYNTFDKWYKKKCESISHEGTYIFKNNILQGFIGIKDEKIEDLPNSKIFLTLTSESKILKICTFKVLKKQQGLKTGEILLKNLLYKCLEDKYNFCYLTILEKSEDKLFLFLKKYGFKKFSEFINKDNKKEIIIGRLLNNISDNDLENFPLINSVKKFKIMTIGEDYHDRLFKEAILKGVKRNDLNKDYPRYFSITKVYVGKNKNILKGDNFFIYRKANSSGKYKSVLTGIAYCKKTYIKGKDYKDINEFKEKIENKHAFNSDEEILKWFKKEQIIIEFVHKLSFGKNNNAFNYDKLKRSEIWGEGHPNNIKISSTNVLKILKESKVNECFIIN